MSNDLLNTTLQESNIKSKIYTIRGVQVMLDSDLAEIYGYTTKRFNEQVKNNISKFPSDFMFQLTVEEADIFLRSIFSTSSLEHGGRRYLPYAFSEQGIYMLMTVLKGELATQQSIALIRTFKQMRDFLQTNAQVFDRLERLEIKQLENKLEADKNFKEIFKQLEAPRSKKAILFFKGQMFDAFSCIADLIRTAKQNIILIDGYVDTATLDLLSKKNHSATVDIYTFHNTCKLTQTEIADFNTQYAGLTLHYTADFHDRFMIIDRHTLYHIGASIKDAGKKAFEISQIDDDKQIQEILKRLTK